MKPIRLGVIGLGLIWLRVHQPRLAELADVIEPVALCDLSEPRRSAAAQLHPQAALFADYTEMLQLPTLDAVLVLTPIALNAPVALAALQAGKDVIMEKPIARSLAEGQTLIETAQRLGKRLYVAEQLAYRQAEGQLAGLLAAGEIGELILWERVQHLEADTAQGEMRYDTTPWRKAADFPLGALFDGGVHLIAALAKVFGAPQAVNASGRNLRAEYGDYDQVTMMFHYANGVTGILSHSSYLPPLRNHFYLYGSAGTILVETNRLVVEKPGEPSRIIDVPGENAYAAMWRALITAYQTNQDPDYSAERALQDVATLIAVEQSIRTGQRILVSSSPSRN